ncbi:MAG: YifB family Mg chelatase-like AAA ATPase [Candidatus Nanopelagicales bacterium]
MSLARAYGVVIAGIDAHIVEVEAHLSSGLPSTTLVGLADTAVSEAASRVRAAVINSGGRWPSGKITVGLSPAWLHKRGSALDLAVAAAVMAADGQLDPAVVRSAVMFGELGLDGRVRPVRGAVVAAVAVARSGHEHLWLAPSAVPEAELIPGLRVRGCVALSELVKSFCPDPAQRGRAARLLTGLGEQTSAAREEPASDPGEPDLADVHGQEEAVAALEIAAAGGHHLAMTGRPGVGKTMLAERLPSILPDLPDEDALTATAIASLQGRSLRGLVRRPPFEAPHHSATLAALVGGGRNQQVSPGAVTLAHGGVLFLDEAPEFAGATLEALRQPLESGTVVISRSGFTARLPARFQLVLAANPCPCGNGIGEGAACRCSSHDRRRYLARLSGPLLDRIDVHLVVAAPRVRSWVPAAGSARSSAEVRERVSLARDRAVARARRLGYPGSVNSRLPAGLLRRELAPDAAAVEVLTQAVNRATISGRAADRSIRVAWSIADCSGVARPGLSEVGRALALRTAQFEKG